MKLNKGLRRDELPVDQPEGSWRDARNVVIYKAFKSVSNEDGVDDVTPTASSGGYENYPTGKKVIGTLPLNTGKVLFFGTTNPADSEIGIVTEDNKYKPVLRDAILNFNENFPIQAAFEYKFNNNLVVAWVDHDGVQSLNPPRVLNFDCLPFRVTSTYAVDPLDLSKATTLMQLFSPYLTPIINPDNLESRDGQGTLKSGTYYPFFSYELADGSVTSYSKIYNPVPIYEDNMTQASEKVGGDTGGVPTSKYIWFKAENVDTNYRYLNIGYLYFNNGVIKAYYVKKYSISTSIVEVSLFGSESTLIEITLNEVLIPNDIYIGAKTITSLQKKLYLGNVEKEAEINYQPDANLINLKWIREKNINVNGRVKSEKTAGVVTTYGSYKDAGLVFFDKSFKSGEAYAFFIAWKLKSGGYSKAFHIPGRDFILGDKNVLNPTATPSDLNDLDGGNAIYEYQVNNTALANGTMGFWENENEEYPLDPSNPSNVHPDFSNIPGISVANRKVRHHVFPDLRALKGFGEDFIVPQGLNSNKTIVVQSGGLANPNNEEYYLHYDNLVSSVGSGFNWAGITGNLSRFDTFTAPGVLIIGHYHFRDFSSNDTGSGFGGVPGVQLGGSGGHYWLTWVVRKNGSPIIAYYADIGGSNSPYPIFSSSFPDPNNAFSNYSINVVPGDYIDIEYFIQTPGSSGTNPDNTNAGDVAAVNAAFGGVFTATFGTRNAGSRPLGIEVSNVNVPADLVDLVDSWEIFYAKRSESNIRVVGQDMVKEGRFHTFDLITSKTINQATYLKPLLDYNAGGGQILDTVTTNPAETQYPTQKIDYISQFFYLGENVSSPVNNTNKAESVYIVAGHAQTNTSFIDTNYGANNTLLDICVYRRNCYAPFQIQNLITTGLNIKVSGVGIQATKKIYGGDVFIVSHGFRDSTTVATHLFLICEAASNIHLRWEDTVNSKFYFPKASTATPSWYGYNRDYNCINDLNQLTIYFSENLCLDGSVTKFPYRIPRSIADSTESKLLNWRTFKVNDYYEMPKNRGVIWNILGGNKILYIHHEYSLFIAEIKDRMGQASGEIFLGTSDLFDRPPSEVQPVNEGYAGTQSQFAIILSRIGYCFVDRQAGKIFIFNMGQPIREISNQGLYHFFKEFAQTKTPLIDNPFIGKGYTMAYDQELNRLITAKTVPDGGEEGDKAFTISYSPDLNEGNGGWISEHDFAPNVLLYNRSGLYSMDNVGFKLFKHNSKTSKSKYYDGTIKDSYIDVVVSPNSEDTKRFENVNWISTVDVNGVVTKDETITNLVVYNDTQCSGRIDLTQDASLWYGKDARNNEDTWNFNNFKDLVKDSTLPFLDGKQQVITSNINTGKAWFNKSNFISKYIIFRLISNNTSQKNVHISSVSSNIKKSDR